MTDYNYKYWKPNSGFEELQAGVFNKANLFKFYLADADQIKTQFEKENINPKTVRYAFLRDEMVGYVQARIREKSKEIHISFPWTVPDTPAEVQDKLFDEMLSFLQKHDTYRNYKIRSNVYAKPESNLEFLKKRRFIEKNAWKSLYLNLSSVSQAEYDKKFQSRIGTEEDISSVVSLINEDGRYSSQFPDDDAIKKYLQESIFSTGHLVLIYENDTLTATSAPLILKPTEDDNERMILRFTAYKDVKNQESFIPLLVEVAKECLSSGYGKNLPLLVFIDSMDSPSDHADFLQQFNPIKSDTFMYYYYLES